MSAAVVAADGLEAVETEYRVESADRQAVAELLRGRDPLHALLCEIAAHVRRHFPDALLRLAPVRDPEDLTMGTRLLVSVVTSLPAAEALERMNRLDEDWWLDASDATEGQIVINLAFA